jgi:Zn-finger nucleic acid-binding protein
VIEERVVCLGCGLAYVEGGAPARGEICRCPPPRPPAPETATWTTPCPRCETEALAARRYADLAAYECARCGGLFVQKAMVERMLGARDAGSALRAALPQREALRERQVRYVRCPACRKHMARNVFGRVSGVIVDVCPADGVWFDGGELAAVLRFVATGGLERGRAHEEQSRADVAAERLRGAQGLAHGASEHYDFATDLADVLSL